MADLAIGLSILLVVGVSGYMSNQYRKETDALEKFIADWNSQKVEMTKDRIYRHEVIEWIRKNQETLPLKDLE